MAQIINKNIAYFFLKYLFKIKKQMIKNNNRKKKTWLNDDEIGFKRTLM